MSFLHRTPLGGLFAAWATCALALTALTGTHLLWSLMLVAGAAQVGDLTQRSVMTLGRHRTLITAALASSAGPWLALASEDVSRWDALLFSGFAIVLSVCIRGELPELRREGIVVYFGLKERAL